MTNGLRLGFALALAVGTIGCGADDLTSQSALTIVRNGQAGQLDAATYGRIGARIDSDPASADQILAKTKLTRTEFESAIRSIAADPQQARRYAEAWEIQKRNSAASVDR